MDRARRAGTAALVIALILVSVGSPAGASRASAADVAWPVSTLVVSELQTGGASASDEFVEIANQGAGPVDLVGLELVYATSSGSTVTRKASWDASFVLDAGRRVLVVNGAGVLRGAWGQGLHRRICRDRRRRRAAGDRRDRGGCPRLGRCDEPIRGGRARGRATGRVEPGAVARWHARERRGHQRQRARLVREPGAEPAAIERWSRAGTRPDADSVANTDADADTARRRRRRRPTPTPTPTRRLRRHTGPDPPDPDPDPDPDPHAHSRPDPESDAVDRPV